MNKKTILIMLIISLAILSGCEISDFQENYLLYKNKEESESKIKSLESDMKINNKEVKTAFDLYENNKNSAKEIESEIMEYLGNERINGYNIYKINIATESFFEYDMIIMKTHLMSYVENHINNTLTNVSVSEKNQAIEVFMDELIKSSKIQYFHNFDTGQLEQVVIFKLDNGFSYMFNMLWEFNYLIEADFIEVQEFDL